MIYVKWIVKIVLGVTLMLVVADYATNPYIVASFIDVTEWTLMKFSLVVDVIRLICIAIALAIFPILARPQPFNISVKMGRHIRLIYLVMPFLFFNLSQKRIVKQYDISFSSTESLVLFILFIGAFYILYKTFVTRAWLGGEDMVESQDEKEMREGIEAYKELKKEVKRIKKENKKK